MIAAVSITAITVVVLVGAFGIAVLVRNYRRRWIAGRRTG